MWTTDTTLPDDVKASVDLLKGNQEQAITAGHDVMGNVSHTFSLPEGAQHLLGELTSLLPELNSLAASQTTGLQNTGQVRG